MTLETGGEEAVGPTVLASRSIYENKYTLRLRQYRHVYNIICNAHCNGRVLVYRDCWCLLVSRSLHYLFITFY